MGGLAIGKYFSPFLPQTIAEIRYDQRSGLGNKTTFFMSVWVELDAKPQNRSKQYIWLKDIFNLKDGEFRSFNEYF